MTPTTASTPAQQPLRVDAGPPRPNAIAAISLSNDWGPPLPGQVRAGTFGHPTHAIRGSRRLARDPGRRARRGGCRRIALDRATATSYEAQCIAAHVAGIHPQLDAEGNAHQRTASTFPHPSSLRPEGPQRSAGAAWRLDPATFIRHSADPPGTPSRIHQTTRASRHQVALARSGRRLDQRHCFKRPQPVLSSLRVARPGLRDHERRCHKIKPVRRDAPPVAGHLLVGGDDDIAGRSCGKVTHNGSFDTGCRLHPEPIKFRSAA